MYIVFYFEYYFNLPPFSDFFFFFFIVNILIFNLFNFCMAEEPPRGSYAIKYVCMYVIRTVSLPTEQRGQAEQVMGA